jgi:hypothetical protein
MGNPILHPVPEEDFVDPSSGVDAAGRVPLGRLLVGQGLITEAQLDNALFESSQTGERLGEIVVRLGLASEEEVAKALADQWSLSYVDRASIWFDADALARLSREDAQRLEALPTRVQDGRVVVAVAEPTEQRLDALREVIGEETVVVVVPRSALDAGLSSGLLASRSPEESVAEESPAPPPVVFEAPVPALPAPFPAFEPAPVEFESLSTAPTPPAASDDLEWFRDRVHRLEAELAKQRAVTVEVQLHLQAALRTLLLNDVGSVEDHSNGGGPAA